MTTIGSLFTGAGALCELAVAPLLGGRVVWHCENDPAACRVLAHRFPGTPNLGDITAVDWSAVERVGVLAGGFPCTDVSPAGRKAGIEGKHSGLWSYFVDAIRILRPGLVLVENSSDLLVRGLDRVLADLAELGFDAEWAVVPAAGVDAPHRRRRCFIAAADPAGPGWGSREPEHVAVDSGVAVRAGQAELGRRDRPAAADADGDRCPQQPERHGASPFGASDHERRRVDSDGRFLGWGPYRPAVERWASVLGRVAPDPIVTGPRGGRQLNPALSEWMMGWPAGWVTDVPGLTSNEMKRLAGNGVVTRQADAAFRHLLPLLSAEGRAA